jgi:hypothetical protein
MRAKRVALMVVALLLLGMLNFARGADKVLASGDPPLTQSLLEKRLKYLEWLLDTQFTAKQRTDYQRLLMQTWKTAKPARQKRMEEYMTKDAEALDQMTPEERVAQQRATLPRMIAAFEKSTYPGERWIADQYRQLYKPGGPKNPILVAGDPPLTQSMVDLETAVVEMLLDVRLTVEQRQKYQQLVLEHWKKADQEERAKWAKSLGTWAKLPTYTNYRRSVARALDQPRNVETWRKDTSALSRWLTALHQSSSTPGSARNPILVDTDPQLTQLVVDAYCDYIQIMLDLSVSGGFTTPQRKVLQDYLVKDWKRLSAEQRNELLGDLRTWSEAAAQGTAAANQCIAAQRPKLLAQLRTARDDARSQWLLEVLGQERQRVERWKKEMEYVAEMQKIADEMRGNIGPRGHWEYDGNTRRNRWVPDR